MLLKLALSAYTGKLSQLTAVVMDCIAKKKKKVRYIPAHFSLLELACVWSKLIKGDASKKGVHFSGHNS